MLEQAIASVVEAAANGSASVASWWMLHQPKVPKTLQKKESKSK
jgi:cyclic lactone autoinducer peptide